MKISVQQFQCPLRCRDHSKTRSQYLMNKTHHKTNDWGCQVNLSAAGVSEPHWRFCSQTLAVPSRDPVTIKPCGPRMLRSIIAGTGTWGYQQLGQLWLESSRIIRVKLSNLDQLETGMFSLFWTLNGLEGTNINIMGEFSIAKTSSVTNGTNFRCFVLSGVPKGPSAN